MARDHLVQRTVGFPAAMRAMSALSSRMAEGRYRLAEVRPEDLVVAHEVRGGCHDLNLDLADAVGVVLADRFRTDAIFTLDQRDYRAIKPLTPTFAAFRLLPADAT